MGWSDEIEGYKVRRCNKKSQEMEAEGGLMDVFDISPKGKKRFAKWIGKRHRKLCISELIRNSKDERQLFAMCRYIDRWYDANEPSMKPLEASMELSEEIDDSDEVIPAPVPEVKQEAPAFVQKELSTKVKGRLNLLVLHHPEVCISEIVNNAADEAELLRRIEEIEKRVVPVDPRIKLWTVRRL